MPNIATTTGAITSAPQYGMPRCVSSSQVTKAPSMYCAPWAKFTTFIRPKMIARPMLSMA